MSETLPWFLLWRKTLDFHRKSFAGNHSSKDFPSPFDVRNYFFDAIISNQYWIKTLKTDSKFFMTFYFLKKVDRDMFWPHLFFQQYIPLKIFIFRIDGRENIIGQTIHRKAKRCLVRFADAILGEFVNLFPFPRNGIPALTHFQCASLHCRLQYSGTFEMLPSGDITGPFNQDKWRGWNSL